jgi:hypothetical protein
MIQAHTVAAVTSLLVLRAEVTSHNFCTGISSVIICIHLSSQKFRYSVKIMLHCMFQNFKIEVESSFLKWGLVRVKEFVIWRDEFRLNGEVNCLNLQERLRGSHLWRKRSYTGQNNISAFDFRPFLSVSKLFDLQAKKFWLFPYWLSWRTFVALLLMVLSNRLCLKRYFMTIRENFSPEYFSKFYCVNWTYNESINEAKYQRQYKKEVLYHVIITNTPTQQTWLLMFKKTIRNFFQIS